MAPSASYPAEDPASLRFGAVASIGLHAGVLGLVILIAFLTHIKTIQQLMAEGGAIAQNGPAAQEQIEVILRPDDLPPPPPTPNPEFIIQRLIEPKPVVIPPPKLVVTPPPKPKPMVHPRYTAPKATGSGESASVSRLIVGSSGFPQPAYPYAALLRHLTGTVNVSIQFDGAGNADDVEVIGSSGVGLLDSNTQDFIRKNWHNDSFAGRRATVPIVYRMQGQ